LIRTNYIFVDFENVQDYDLDRIAHKPIKVTLVLGRRHKSLPLQAEAGAVSLRPRGRRGTHREVIRRRFP
jgi:hypothetical protein